ncbi:MAG: N-acetylneuraminate synthase family protein [Armatimonadota bacterium]
MHQPVHIIADACTNHSGCLETALRLADAALASGMSSIKFQMINPEGLYLPEFYRGGDYAINEVYESRKSGMLSDDEYRRLADHCRGLGLPMSASVFDIKGLNLLEELDPPYIKMASVDLNNSALLKEAASRGRRMIVSTGMATLGEIERAVTDILSTGNNDLILMHCVSVYPCPLENMNLGFIDVLCAAFGLPVGLSDHSEGSLAAAIAASMGVEWFERHFTLDRSAKGFDHAHSSDPDQIAGYASDIMRSAAANEHQPVKVGESEATVKLRARRGLYAARDIAMGEVISENDILVVRPESAMRPNDAPLIVGRKAAADIRKYEAFAPASVLWVNE